MTDKKRPLPPLPEAPKRSLTPPARRAVTDAFKLDDPTPTKAHSVAEYQALLSVFDPLNDAEREAFTELAFIFGELNARKRQVLIVAARKLLEGP